MTDQEAPVPQEAPAEPVKVVLRRRHQFEVNNDPQRRCYHGCHFSTELVWGPWEILEWPLAEKAEERLKSWRELNDFAISQRGESARCEYEVLPMGDPKLQSRY